MKRQRFYPSRIGDQVNWLDNFATKLAFYGTVLNVTGTNLSDALNDAKYGKYVLGSWLSGVRTFTPATTDAVDDLLEGIGTGVVALPTFTAPTLPAGVTAVVPGLLTRLFALIAKIKLESGYTQAIGTDLGIIGPEDSDMPDLPKVTAKVEQGATSQCVRLTFAKYGHMGVYLESRRGGGAWEFLAVDTESPYLDERPLLVATSPEIREYRTRFWDKGTPNGEWTDVVKVTVSP